MKYAIVILLLYLAPSSFCFSQNDTINQLDENDMKQGYWVYYGKDRPYAGYPDSAIIEAGFYLNNRKEGVWKKYNKDGSLKLRGEYKNNRPAGVFTKGGTPHPTSSLNELPSSCEEKKYDSIEVRLNHANSYGPITDTTIVVYNDNSELSNYLDSISRMGKSFQTPDGQFCSHVIEIRIWRYTNGIFCSSRFNTCNRKSETAKIARECAEKVFGFK
jgi:hypothetical protein